MPQSPDTPVQNSEPAAQPAVPHLELKARLLLLFTAVLIGGSALYLLYSRGVFEPTQLLVLTAEDSEGVVVGMDVTFSGFPIGRVNRVELAQDGNVRILVDVARKDAHWLRTSSVFTLTRGVVGGTNIRAFTGMLADPPLAEGAIRPVLRGDATAELPRVIAAAKETLENIVAMTAQDAPLRNTLAGTQELMNRMKGPRGAMGVLLGSDEDAKKIVAALDRANVLLARMDTLAARVDSLAIKADTQVFGQQGLVKDAQTAVRQIDALLADTRASLKKIDTVMAEAQAVGANVRSATTDLGALRSDVDSNLRKIEGLVNEINRKWPFARDNEIRVP